MGLAWDGIYFWENNYARAYEWAVDHCKKGPAVIGAIINLGLCLNLTDYGAKEELEFGYNILKTDCENFRIKLPENRNIKDNSDLLVRELDCAVIQRIHKYRSGADLRAYDSVRGVFVEGNQVYPNSGFMEKTHTQLCIINPNCIKGYFNAQNNNNDFIRI
ncbi:MAG: hypothetical protein WCD89_21695 [Anaerocolumna sp.]